MVFDVSLVCLANELGWSGWTRNDLFGARVATFSFSILYVFHLHRLSSGLRLLHGLNFRSCFLVDGLAVFFMDGLRYLFFSFYGRRLGAFT